MKKDDFSVMKKLNMKDLANTYDVLGEACFLINKVFNLSIFMYLVTTFIFIVLTIWWSIYIITGRAQDSNESSSLFIVTVWCISKTMSVGAMCFGCCNLNETRDKTKVFINDIIMNYGIVKTTRQQAKSFLELLECWPLNIYIYDMFNVDISLMLKFTSVSTTYLIIIIQVSHFIE
uniref:Putative gustatory receptor 4 n=1 Tax=Conopomorpha sinensis TaxID=940481 RepID=A0A3Q8HM60_9NEOP|nr:putative gustatory receptor 4 [Conopomorpha sinensis]